jgi:hypothetical protein
VSKHPSPQRTTPILASQYMRKIMDSFSLTAEEITSRRFRLTIYVTLVEETRSNYIYFAYKSSAVEITWKKHIELKQRAIPVTGRWGL